MLPNDCLLPPMKVRTDIPEILLLDQEEPAVCFRRSPLFLSLRRNHPQFDLIVAVLRDALHEREVKYLYTLTDDQLIYAGRPERDELESETIGDVYAAVT